MIDTVGRTFVVVAILAVPLRAQCPDGTPPPCGRATRPSTKSLAVMPFEAVGGDTANQYFAEGLSDELTTALSHVGELRVVAIRSTSPTQGDAGDVARIGSELHVTAVLEGRVRRAGGLMRVVARLTSTVDGSLMWSNSYEREVRDVFEVQDDITREIVGALRVRLTGGVGPTTARRGTPDLQAYDLYLRGLYLYQRRGSGLSRAADYFEQAIARDSGFASAYAALAMTLFASPYYQALSPAAVRDRARRAAERSVQLDDRRGEGHLAMSVVHVMSLEWVAAEAEARRAMALDTGSGEAAYRLGFILLTVGRLPEGVAALERARELDPLYSLVAAYLGHGYALEGRADSALSLAHRAFELDSTLAGNQTLVTATFGELDRFAEAGAYAHRFLAVQTDERRMGILAGELGRSGATDEAQAVIARLERLPAGAPRRDAGLAYSYLGVGDTARALTAMEHAVDTDGYLLLSVIPISHVFDPVRASPRFAAVLARLNLAGTRLTDPHWGRSP